MAMNMQTSDPAAAGASQMMGGAAPAQPNAGGPQQIVLQAVGDGTWSITVDGQPGQQPMQPQEVCDAVEEMLGAGEAGDENETTEPNAQAAWDQEADKRQKARAMQDSY